LGQATVVVTEDQLSLAIGKHGQNVRLAAMLTGWDIDILTPDEYNKQVDWMTETLKGVEGINDRFIDKLLALGIISVMDLDEVGVKPLISELGVDAALAEKIIAAAREASKTAAAENVQTQAQSLLRQEKSKKRKRK
jgi:N utilization substance protein A